MITIVVAMGLKNEIGANNQLLWHLPKDLKHFKEITTGHPIIMGRKTYESIGKPLPNRTNIVVSTKKDWFEEGILIVGSLKEAIKLMASFFFGIHKFEKRLSLRNAVLVLKSFFVQDSLYKHKVS